MLAGDENDLLSESPVFTKAKAQQAQKVAQSQGGPFDIAPQNNGADDEFEEIDEQLINEIEDYLKGVMENNEKLIEMSDSSIGSSGAKCVAAAINFCEGLLELKLSNCSIKDSGARSLFDELANSKTV